MREPTSEEIRERLQRHLEDPEVIADLRRSMESARAGHVLPYRIFGPVTLFDLPGWLVTFLFWIAPYTWGRSTRRLFARSDTREEER